jgi:hypothetical protein
MLKLDTFFGIIFILMIMAAVYFVENLVNDLRSNISENNYTIREYKQDIHVLTAEWSYLNNPDRLRKLAVQFLNQDFSAQVKFADIKSVPMTSSVITQTDKDASATVNR